MTDNLSKCAICNKTLIDEEFDNHKCSKTVNGKIIHIEVDYWIEGRHPETGDKIISARAFDGTNYWIIKRTRKLSDKMPFMPSDENLQAEDSDADLTEPQGISYNISSHQCPQRLPKTIQNTCFTILPL